MTIDEAVAVFVGGFTFTRSFAHPFEPTEAAPGLWVLGDAPRTRGPVRGDEVVAVEPDRRGLDAAAVDALARRHARPHFTLCVVLGAATADGPVRAAYKALGYRLVATEPLMARDLADRATVPAAPADGIAGDRRLAVERVTTEAEAAQLAKAARRRQILPEHLRAEPPPIRAYVARDGRAPFGWVSSVAVGPHTWCSNLFVAAPYRRRGVATALMRRLLADDAAAGFGANVLLASHAGAQLYPTLGYATLGRALIFTRPRRR